MPRTTTVKPIVQLTLRLEPRVYESVVTQAAQKQLSLNTWITEAIQEKVARR